MFKRILCILLAVMWLCSARAAVLEVGSKGSDVEKVQKRLIQYGYLSGSADGRYGDATRKAVRLFQQKNGLVSARYFSAAAPDFEFYWPAGMMYTCGLTNVGPGGVMEMERAKGLSTLKGLYEFAKDSEYDAMQKYAEFADKCDSQGIREAFLAIASEEASHYAELQRKLTALSEA